MWTVEDFNIAIVAQDDDQDYQESGYVAAVKDGRAYLGAYGHCSCYDTFTSLCGGGISDYYKAGEPEWVWEGTWEELVAMAKRRADPALPMRTADPKDRDYDHLMQVYDQILAKYAP